MAGYILMQDKMNWILSVPPKSVAEPVAAEPVPQAESLGQAPSDAAADSTVSLEKMQQGQRGDTSSSKQEP